VVDALKIKIKNIKSTKRYYLETSGNFIKETKIQEYLFKNFPNVLNKHHEEKKKEGFHHDQEKKNKSPY
jgi:hypothetical protein